MDTKDRVGDLRREVHAAGYYSQQLRSGKWDGTVEFLVEAILELQDHIDGEDERRPVPARELASDVGRRLTDFARGLHCARLSNRGDSYEDAPLQDPSRAWPCRQAAHALDRGEVTFDALLVALRAVLDEADDRGSAVREAEDANAEIMSLQSALDRVEERIHDMISDVAAITDHGHPRPYLLEWEELVEHLRARQEPQTPQTCPVPRCSESVLRTAIRSDDRGTWPPDLCERHTFMRFGAFDARVRSELPDHVGATHAALVPRPALAHLAPSPEELADPPGPSVWHRLLEDDGT